MSRTLFTPLDTEKDKTDLYSERFYNITLINKRFKSRVWPKCCIEQYEAMVAARGAQAHSTPGSPCEIVLNRRSLFSVLLPAHDTHKVCTREENVQ